MMFISNAPKTQLLISQQCKTATALISHHTVVTIGQLQKKRSSLVQVKIGFKQDKDCIKTYIGANPA